MSQFNLVAYPERSPTQCRFCGDFEGPMIDTLVDDPVYGHVYICVPTDKRPGCVGNMALMCGYRPLQQVLDLEAALEVAQQEIARLKSSKKVTLTADEYNKLLNAGFAVGGGGNTYFPGGQ